MNDIIAFGNSTKEALFRHVCYYIWLTWLCFGKKRSRQRVSFQDQKKYFYFLSVLEMAASILRIVAVRNEILFSHKGQSIIDSTSHSKV